MITNIRLSKIVIILSTLANYSLTACPDGILDDGEECDTNGATLCCTANCKPLGESFVLYDLVSSSILRYNFCVQGCGSGSCYDNLIAGVDMVECDAQCKVLPGAYCWGISIPNEPDTFMCAPVVATPQPTPEPTPPPPEPTTYVDPLLKCQEFARKFYQTDEGKYQPKSYEPPSVRDLLSRRVFSREMHECHINNQHKPECSWYQKLKVSCSLDDEDIPYIRVQTNSLPDHPFKRGEHGFPRNNYIDFKVKFDFAEQQDTRILSLQNVNEDDLCSISWIDSDNLQQSGVSLQDISGFTDQVVGVLINGVPLYSGYSATAKYDALQAYEESIDGANLIDNCLGDYDANGFYHYFSFSPCVTEQILKQNLIPKYCSETEGCKDNIFQYGINQVDTSNKKLQVIGIAKDGHRIYGPYKDDGTLWQPCDVDVCNGVVIDGSYSYVMTSFFPYTIGCWGPATSENIAISCSTNERDCFIP